MAETFPEPRPTARRMVLGTQLRHLRETAGFTREDAGDAIQVSEAKISRLELGYIKFQESDVRDLFVLYGGTDQDELTKLLDLASLANEPGWGQSLN